MSRQQTKIFFPNLDGLRFIAFFAVFVHHSLIVKCFSPNPASEVSKFAMAQKLNGALGVNLFFVLSGFLITFLLLNEKSVFKKVHVYGFYMRRILRIWPLYFLMVVAGFIIFPLIKKMMGGIPDETHTAGWYLFFASNFQMIEKGFADSSILNVLWSVGVEEQFYIVWPLILAFVPAKYLVRFFVLLLAVTAVFRAVHAAEAQVIYYHSVAVFGDMVIGGLLAWLAFYHPPFVKAIAHMPKKIIAAVYAAGLFIILFNYKIFTTPALHAAGRYVYALFFAFVIAEQNFAQHSLFKLADNKFLSRWGNYTYGLYCLHTIGLLVAHIVSEKIIKLSNPWLIMGIDFTLGLGLSMLMAYVSYRFFEAPFLKLKNKFAYITK